MKATKVPRSLRAARVGIFSALCVVGSVIPFPSPVGSIGFDSAPGFFTALMFGPIEGALICGIGHMAGAYFGGFLLGPWHIVIALAMAFTGFAMAVVNTRFGVILASVVAVALNTGFFPLAAPVMGWLGATTLIPLLLVAASLNVAVAAVAYKSMRTIKSIR